MFTQCELPWHCSRFVPFVTIYCVVNSRLQLKSGEKKKFSNRLTFHFKHNMHSVLFFSVHWLLLKSILFLWHDVKLRKAESWTKFVTSSRAYLAPNVANRRFWIKQDIEKSQWRHCLWLQWNFNFIFFVSSLFAESETERKESYSKINHKLWIQSINNINNMWLRLLLSSMAINCSNRKMKKITEEEKTWIERIESHFYETQMV